VTSGGLVDERVRERIAGDLGANLCVEAAAGTGKTTVLVRRVASLLAAGTVSVDELVVITFTEKAAAELSTRVRDELERRAAAADDEEQRRRLLRAARDLYRAHIETIHSFATALLRERPVEAGIDPLFDILEELAAGLDFDEAYERFQDALLSSEDHSLERALRRGFGLQELREACEHLHTHRYLLPLAHPERPGDDVGCTLGDLRDMAAELRAIMQRHRPADRLVDVVEAIVAWIDELDALNDAELERVLVSGFRPRTNKAVGSNASWGGEKQRVKDLQQRYDETVDAAKQALSTDALLGLLPRIEAFVREYARERKRRGKADFDDLLYWARDLVRDSEPARRYFRGRFRAVLIDEFQDTDPIQAELALLLTSDGEPGGDWSALAPAPGRLTVVGDPKQSIYRFRRADIAVYDRVRSRPLAGATERIVTSFRSNAQLLRALNAAFDTIFIAEYGVQPGNVALEPPPGAPSAARPPVVIAEGSVEGNAEAVRKEEARVVAGLLHAARQEGWEIRDRRENDRTRACRWGDMALLMPARTGIEHYEQALAAARIPYRHEGSRDFFQRDEVRDLIWVLSAADDPTDRIALVGALRSGAFAISDEELVIHAAEAGALSYRAPKTGPSPSVNEAMAELRDLHRLRRSVSPAELVRRVVERTRLVELALTRPDGEQGAANLLAIVDEARLFAAAGGGGLRPFIRHLRDSMEAEAIEIEATVAEETDDVVRIMTAHGAKGLEYPIVALANLGSRHHAPREPVPREQESFLHFRVGAETAARHGHFATPGYDAVWEDEKAHIDAERLRLLYVAATRARDHLLLPCVVGRHAAGELLGALVNALPQDPSLVEVVEAAEVTAPSADAGERPRATEDELTAALAERRAWSEARTALKRTASVERRIETASSRERAYRPLAAEVATFEAALVIGQGPPIPIGDAVHMVMERVGLPGAEDLERIAEDLCLEGDNASDLPDVISMCRACLAAPSVGRALELGSWWREVPFVISDAADAQVAESAPLTNGRVDLVFRDGDELVVVDYKTDKDVTEETAEEYALKHHSGQSEVYAQGLARATGLRVREVAFVYCKAGAEVRLRDGQVLGRTTPRTARPG
jgi:ATP-dependent helicase/nuclease subunit A